MSEEGQRQYFNPIPPVESTTPGVGVTYLAATTAAAKSEDLTAFPALFECYLELIASGDKIWVTFSSDGVTDIDKTAAGAATFALGTAKKNGVPIGNGSVLVVRLSKDVKYLHWQADSSSSTLIVRPASQQSLSALAGGT